jgi:hypothetical protein
VVEESHVSTAESQPPYEFELSRVTETTKRGQHDYYDWPVHMASKTWVDVRLFNEAFDRALRFHAEQSGEPINEDMLRESLLEAHRIENDRT